MPTEASKFQGKAIINGRFLDGGGERRIALVNPADNAETGAFAASTSAQVDSAAKAARAAFEKGVWHSQPPPFRKAVLSQWSDLIEKNREELASRDLLDMGKPISAARFEVGIAAGFARYYAEAIDKFYPGRTAPTFPGACELQVRRPRGVVAAITPWNFPVVNAMMKLSQILAAGNTAILKPSEQSPRSAELLVQLALEAGMPPGVLNLVQGDGETGSALAAHHDVDLVAFTGSTRTGRALMSAIGESSLKPVMLECGGKSPELVFADIAASDRPDIARAIVANAMMNTGQVCVARSRLYLEDAIFDEMLELVTAAARAMAPSDPRDETTQMGPLASRKQTKTVLSYIEAGVADGGALVLDGRRNDASGCYIGPTLFTGLRDDARMVREEIFGPVISIARFSSESEAISRANASPYALAATVWTTNLRRAHEIPAALNAGMVRVQACAAPNPVGGYAHAGEPAKQSGFGIEGGMLALESFSRLQSIETVFGAAGTP